MPLSAAANNVFKLADQETADAFLQRAYNKKYAATLGDRASEFVLKRTGAAEYLHGNKPLIAFDYVRRCVTLGSRPDLTVHIWVFAHYYYY